MLAAIAIVTVVVIGAWGSAGHHGDDDDQAAGEARAARIVVPGLQITAVRGPSYVAVRRGGAAGRVIFQGTVARGQHPSFAGTRFWVNVSTPENLVIKVRGERIRLVGFKPQVVTVDARLLARGVEPRAAIVVTGCELVRGDRTDANGPFFARSLFSLGIEAARITVVGDSAEALEGALREGLEHDLLVVSGGLGPDARRPHGRAPGARRRARARDRPGARGRRSRAVARGRGAAAAPVRGLRRGSEKAGDGARRRDRRRRRGNRAGARREGGRLRRRAAARPAARAGGALAGRARGGAACGRSSREPRPPVRRTLRFFGVSEQAVARALAEAGGDGDGVEATICAHNFEIHVDLITEAGAEARADELAERLAEPLAAYLYARDDPASIEEHVLRLCRERGLTLATAESCTGGMVAEKLTSVPGSSDVFLGAVVAYANDVKAGVLGVGADVLAELGAVSAETAAAMAEGVRARLGADVGVAVTGVAGPGGGTAEKPVGLVYVHAAGPNGGLADESAYGGDRETVRRRATASALHLVRKLVTEL